MKKYLLFLTIIAFLSSCNSSDNGYLVGAKDRPDWFQPDPFGMLYIPMGSFNMGCGDQDVPYSQTVQAKTVSVQAFYMDETEITNNEYRQFVYWVRDSIVHKKLGESIEDHLVTQNEYEEDIEPLVNWSTRIDWDGDEERPIIAENLCLPENERFYRHKEFDTRKFNYEYFYIDYKEAAQKDYQDPVPQKDIASQKDPVESEYFDPASYLNRKQGLTDRSVYIKRDVINVYPDTLCYVFDFTYSFNDPMTLNYFWHPAYDHYPVVGVNWKQATAFCVWRTRMLDDWLTSQGDLPVNDFRLPTESEWEWGSRGGLDLSPYPWGGPYIRNSNGCFIGNYKPLRGNYPDDGGFHTLIVGHYAPNDFGLYDMGGNASEWTSNAFDESAYNFAHDLNMDYRYNVKVDDPPTLKRKVIRGGSWKDIGAYMRNDTRSYEYQDTCKSYIGFRCVQTYLGRAKGDGPGASNVYN